MGVRNRKQTEVTNFHKYEQIFRLDKREFKCNTWASVFLKLLINSHSWPLIVKKN